jgi:hypothetical protein
MEWSVGINNNCARTTIPRMESSNVFDKEPSPDNIYYLD